jgi:hypothetical protein
VLPLPVTGRFVSPSAQAGPKKRRDECCRRLNVGGACIWKGSDATENNGKLCIKKGKFKQNWPAHKDDAESTARQAT